MEYSMHKIHRAFVLSAGFILLLAGCRGMHSEKSPIHINPNMDRQEKFIGQQENPFFENSMAMRKPVAGTVPRGFLREDSPFYRGRDENGALIAALPIAVTRQVLERGQDRYAIYCTVCHGEAGDGKGIVMTGNSGAGYGYIPAPNFHTDRFRDLEDGHFYEIISNGTPAGTMPGYAQQIPVADRWAIVAYIRALQRSQNASSDDVPADQRLGLEQ